jgi:hypothetical protein
LLAACSLVIDTSGLSGSSSSDAAPENESQYDADAASMPDADAGVTVPIDGETDADAGVPVLARDTFTRTVTNGLGVAEVGGPWSLSADPSFFQVAGGTATVVVAAAGQGPSAALESVSTDDADVQVVFSPDKLGTGSGLYLSVLGRVVGSDEYHAVAAIAPSGNLDFILVRRQGAETNLAGKNGLLSVIPGVQLRVRLQVTGTSPTHLRAKIWRPTDSEPATWNVEATDSTPSLQVKGYVAVTAYLSSTATNAPIRVSVDDLLVRPASLVP